jgi:hypothetical protein
MKRFLLRGTTALVATIAALAAASTASADVGGAVGGFNSPAAGTMPLYANGRSTAARLDNATVTVDGVLVKSDAFCDDPQADCYTKAELPWDTTLFSDGIHHITVTVTDVAGESGKVFDSDFEIWNHRPPAWSPTATLNIGSDPTAEPQPAPGAGGSGGGVAGASANSCTSPKLSMELAQKPLRISKRTPVLLKGKRYRFTGRLTCLINGKRHSATKGARIDVRNIVRGKTVRKSGTTVRASGKITLLLSYPSARTIEFRFTNADGKTTKVRIKILIETKKKG